LYKGTANISEDRGKK